VSFLVDLHTHTREASACASQSADELVSRALSVGLNGLAVTDHNRIDGALKAQRLGRRRGLAVFAGVEVQTEELGDILVYGVRRDFPDAPMSFRRLARTVEREGGVMFAAHPFRQQVHSGLWTYFEDVGFDWRRGMVLPELVRPLTGVEIYNGGCTPEENEAAAIFAGRFRLRGIAGSDAHGQWRVGWCATEFEYELRSDEELVEALRLGRFRVSRMQSEFDSDQERAVHLKAMHRLRGQELADYVENWMRRKQRRS